MAYKKTSKKVTPTRRNTYTYNTNGPSTYSTSSKEGNTTYTNTSKGNKSYSTETRKDSDGFVTKKRITNNPKIQKNKGSPLGDMIVFFVVIFGTIIGWIFF